MQLPYDRILCSWSAWQILCCTAGRRATVFAGALFLVSFDPVSPIECQHLLGSHWRLVPQRRVRQLQHILRGRHGDAHVCGHSREQFQLRIVEFDDRVVGNHVLHGGRIHPDLADHSAKRVLGEGIHLERDGLPQFDVANIRLVRFGVYQHLLQILCDGKDRWRLQ